MSRVKARLDHQEDLEVGKLGEFADKKQLCEAEALVVLKEKIRFNAASGRKENKKMNEWNERLTTRQNAERYSAIEQVYQIRNAFGIFGAFFTEAEIAQIIDLRPEDSEVAKGLIPTLKMEGRKIDEEELANLVHFAFDIQGKIEEQKLKQAAAVAKAHGNADVAEVPSPASNAPAYSPAYAHPRPADRAGGVVSPRSAGVFSSTGEASPPPAMPDPPMADASMRGDDYTDLLEI